jgi:hypothetical protein
MSAPQGLATFPGVEHLISASITLQNGIEPSTAELVFAPQPDFSTESGTLTFAMNGTSVVFPDCKVDRGSVERNARGEVCRLSLLDRRWKWRFGQISGKYNVRREDATIQNGGSGGGPVADTERTPRELAALYLDAMGESGYDVSELANETRPSVDHEYDNPADALARLCESLGCRIVLRLDNTVRIVRAGAGGELPQGFLLEDSPAVNLPEKPERIAVVCGPSLFQVDFPLEAVGLDVVEGAEGSQSETIKPIDDLSYKPAGGWAAADVPYFYNVAATASKQRALAVKSVFRYYRIMTPVNVPGYDGSPDGRITRLEQVLPIFEEQVRTAGENFDAKPLAAAVFGVWYPNIDELANTEPSLTLQGDSPPASATGDASKTPFYLRGFAIDTARGLVIFDEPVFKNGTPGAASVRPEPAQLVLRAKCHVRDAESLALERYVRERATGGNLNTSPRYIRRDELVVAHTPTYEPASYANFPAGGVDPRAVASVATNRNEIDEACDDIIDAALAEYDQPQARQIRAIGIRPIELDGAIVQVTYSVGPSGATTTAARNSEAAHVGLGHGERRASSLARMAVEEGEKLRSPAAARKIRREAAAGRRAR